ncbi:MAG TPA: hypothetical protein VIW23_08555 [Candidatus Acidoferrum sp.]|jgi:hypothetical protein
MYRPRVEMSIGEMVRAAFKNFRRYDTPANDFKVVGAAKDKDAFARSEISGVIKQLALEGQLIYAPAVSAALQAAKDQHPYHDFRAKAFDERILDKAEEVGFDITSATDLTDICAWLIEEKNERIELSAYGREYQQQQAEKKKIAERRLRLLSSILAGRKSTYEQWDPKRYKIVYVDAAALEPKSIADLEQIEREVLELRRKQNTTREDQRQELRQIADSNKDYKPYRPGDTDSLDTDAVPSRYSDDSGSPIAGRVDARSYSKNEKVVVGGEASSAVKNDPFISPVTGRELSKAEVYGLAKNDLKTFRALMKKDTARLNRIIN